MGSQKQQMKEGSQLKRRVEREDMAQRIVQDYSVDLEFKKPSHILGMAFSEKWQILGLVASDGRIFFYQSKHQGAFNLKPLFTIDASELTIQINIWYMEKHDVWLTVGKDNVVREWTISEEALGLDGAEDDGQSAKIERTGKNIANIFSKGSKKTS